MDPTQVASLTGLLTTLGMGHYAAGITSLVALAFAVAPQIMPFLPVPEASSAGWYRFSYAVLSKLTGNRGPNAPVPASTLAVAKASTLLGAFAANEGGIVFPATTLAPLATVAHTDTKAL